MSVKDPSVSLSASAKMDAVVTVAAADESESHEYASDVVPVVLENPVTSGEDSEEAAKVDPDGPALLKLVTSSGHGVADAEEQAEAAGTFDTAIRGARNGGTFNESVGKAPQELNSSAVPGVRPVPRGKLQAHMRTISSGGISLPGHDLAEEREEEDVPKPQSGWRRFLPFNPDKADERARSYPLLTSGWLSRITYHWWTRLLITGFKRPLQSEDLWKIHPEDSAEETEQKFEREWAKEKAKVNGDTSRASVGWAFFNAFRTNLILAMLMYACHQVLLFIGSVVFVYELIRYVEAEDGTRSLGDGLILVFTFLVDDLLRALMFCFHFHYALRAGIQIRAAFITLVYQKVLRMRNLGSMTIGQVINLCVNDGHRMFESAYYGGAGIGAPILSVGCIVFTTVRIGWPGFLGCVVFFAFFPVQAYLSTRIGVYRERAVKVTDMRVRKMSEILNFVKLIKMYAWEFAFSGQVSSIRRKEQTELQKSGMFTAFVLAVNPAVPLVSTAVALSVRVLTGGDLSHSDAYAVLSSFLVLQFGIHAFSFSLRSLSEAAVAVRRFKALLMMPEVETVRSEIKDASNCIEIDRAFLAWDSVSEEDAVSRANAESAVISNSDVADKYLQRDADPLKEKPATTATLTDVSLCVKLGELVGVCGVFGSGKTSLISAVFGAMNVQSGSVGVKGSIAYVPQQAWIINATVRDNILFGCAYDRKKYEKVLAVAALVPDLKILPDGDQTEIGERGINLSGGQKQRVSLARALYAERDVYLLDDPLSAVDAHVGSHIFNELIKKELSGKTVILVTHQLQYLPMCDRVVMMEGGQIAEVGTCSKLMEAKGAFHSLMALYIEEEAAIANTEAAAEDRKDIEEVLEMAQEEKHDVKSLQRQLTNMSLRASKRGSRKRHGGSTRANAAEKKIVQPAKKLVEEEDRAVGSVSWGSYLALFSAAGGTLVALILFLSSAVAKTSSFIFFWWIGYWIGRGDGNSTIVNMSSVVSGDEDISLNPNLNLYVGITFILAIGTGLMYCIQGVILQVSMLRASSNLHNFVFRRVFLAPMSFFDTTPTGRILNRFSKDLDEIDSQVPWLLSSALLIGLSATVGAVSAAVVYPVLLAPIGVVLLLFFAFQYAFNRTNRELKRLDNISRSPVVSHLGSSVLGLSSIHAYEKTMEFVRSFSVYVNHNTVCFQAFYSGVWWDGLRLDLISTIFIFCAVLMVVVNRDSTSVGNAGFVLTSVIGIGALLQYAVHFFSELQARFTSVERINHYATKTPIEAAHHKPDNKPADDWPHHGKVVFDSVVMRYRTGTPVVLHGLSFSTVAQEKIGVIGRTGAGKSSLAVCLLRLVEIESGCILIDGVDISTLGLYDLRSRISIIPQDPVLFIGSIRYNFDPFNNHSEEEITEAIRQTHLQDTIDALPDGLQTEVLENGENFSVGERQLMCMARALLRHSKVLILDEATASIDSETDALIQRTIRECFADCTLLTIAHRLNTVLDSDRLLVMDQGKVAEFDTPAKLLMNPHSLFRQMLSAAHMETK